MDSSTNPALVVFAWGNASRGDDGIGPQMAGRLRELAHPAVTIVEDHQLNIEHVMDICEHAPVLFVDASIAIDRSFCIERVVPSDDGNFSTHAISPAALLNVYCATRKLPAPDAYLLHIAGRCFELGDGLSSEAEDAVSVAWALLKTILAHPDAEWPKRLAQAVA